MVSFKWLRCQEWCGDAHDSTLPSRSSHTREDVSSVPTTQGGFRPTSTPIPAALLPGTRLVRWRCLRPLVCIHVLMDNHLPLLTLHGFHCALAHALPSSWHALLTTHAQVLPILQSVAQTLPSPEVTHLPADDNALPSLTLSCPFSVPSGTEHFLPWSYPGPSLSHSPT